MFLKHSAVCFVDGIKQLLPNLAAAGVIETAAGVTAGTVSVATGGLLAPIALIGGAIAVYAGLNYHARKSGAQQVEDLRRTLDLLQLHAKKEDAQLDDISGELTALGFDLRFDLDETLTRLEEIKGLVRLQGENDDEILEYLRKHEGLFLSLGGFLEENFDALLAAGVELQGTVDELKAEMAEQRKLMEAVKKDTSALREGQAEILDKQQRTDAKIDQIVDHFMVQLGQRDTEIASLREQVRDAILAKVEAERAAGGSVEAMLERLRRGDPNKLLEFLDDRVADHESQLIEHHRERAAVAYVVGDINRALDSLNRILALFPDDLDSINRLGHIYKLRGELPEAEAQYRKLLKLAPDDKHALAAAYSNLGGIYLTRGDPSGAEKMLNKTLAIDKKRGHWDGMAIAYGNLVLIYKARGNLKEAEKMLRKALAINEKLGRREGMAIQYGNLGAIYHTRGDTNEAEKNYREALAIHEKLGCLEGMANQYGNLGGIYKTRGKLVKARQLWIQSRDLYLQLGATHMAEKYQGWIDGLPPE